MCLAGIWSGNMLQCLVPQLAQNPSDQWLVSVLIRRTIVIPVLVERQRFMLSRLLLIGFSNPVMPMQIVFKISKMK